MPAVERDSQIVGVESGDVPAAGVIAVQVEHLPPAWLDVALVAMRPLENDERPIKSHAARRAGRQARLRAQPRAWHRG